MLLLRCLNLMLHPSCQPPTANREAANTCALQFLLATIHIVALGSGYVPQQTGHRHCRNVFSVYPHRYGNSMVATLLLWALLCPRAA